MHERKLVGRHFSWYELAYLTLVACKALDQIPSIKSWQWMQVYRYVWVNEGSHSLDLEISIPKSHLLHFIKYSCVDASRCFNLTDHRNLDQSVKSAALPVCFDVKTYNWLDTKRVRAKWVSIKETKPLKAKGQRAKPERIHRKLRILTTYDSRFMGLYFECQQFTSDFSSVYKFMSHFNASNF